MQKLSEPLRTDLATGMKITAIGVVVAGCAIFGLSAIFSSAEVPDSDYFTTVADGSIVKITIDESDGVFNIPGLHNFSSGIEPNELYSTNNLFNIANDYYSTTSSLAITWDGGVIIFALDGDELKLTGDIDKMGEPAKIFFDEYIKPMADEYIRQNCE